MKNLRELKLHSFVVVLLNMIIDLSEKA